MKKIFSFYFPFTKEKLVSPIEILTPKGKKISLPKFRYLGFKLPKNINDKFLRKIGENYMKMRKIEDLYIFASADGITWRGKGDDLEYFLRFYFSLANKKILEFNLKRLRNKKN